MKQRLFFAFTPDAAALADTVLAAERVRAENPDCHWRPIAPARLHVTALFVGTYEDSVPVDVEAAAMAAGGTVMHEVFVASFNRVESFGRRLGEIPIVLVGNRIDAAARINAALRGALADARVAIDTTHAFVPHVTLAYGSRVPAGMLPEPVVWRVTALTLFKSRDRVPGYEQAAVWPLRKKPA